MRTTLTEIFRLFGDVVEIAVTVLLAYVVYRLAVLLKTLTKRIRDES